jgi:hypothetical protein
MRSTASRLSGLLFALALACNLAVAATPATNYQLYCMGCHVADGSGLPGKVPSIRETLVGFALLDDGRRFLVQVPGSAQSPLSNGDTAQLLNWMIRNLALEKAPAALRDFTEGEVAGYRSQRLVTVRATRAQLLARIRAKSP